LQPRFHCSEVRSADQRRALFVLVQSYEAYLPEHLRHGSLDENRLDQMLSPPNTAFIAESDDAPLGCVLVAHLDDSTTIIQRLYVSTEARGLGLGRALMDAAIAHARAKHYRRLVLDTQKDALEPAYRLYLSLGFRPCESFMPVSYDDPTYMELPL
jgi:GNAT superfamily N-acetyltransferase